MNCTDWKILDTGMGTAQENMSFDADLLQNLDPQGPPILHFYGWEGACVTYGHFVEPSEFFNLDKVKEAGLNLAKRPTGGGIVFHIWDFAFSLLIPSGHQYFSKNTLENYEFVNRIVLNAVKEWIKEKKGLKLTPSDASVLSEECKRFCMARPTKYDVIFQGKKIAGAAQRKTKKGFLHQGTIAMKIPDTAVLNRVLKKGKKIIEATLSYTYPLMEGGDLELGREKLKERLINHFTKEDIYV